VKREEKKKDLSSSKVKNKKIKWREGTVRSG
jgi:hypothetical protein